MDEKTFRDFAFFNSFLSRGRWKSLALFPVAMAGMGLLNLKTGSPFLFKLFLVLAAAGPVLYILFFKITLKNQIKANNLKEGRLVYTALFRDGLIEIANDHEKQPVEWENIYRIYRYKDYFYLYATLTHAFILPAKGLIEGSSIENFWKFAKQMAPEGRSKSYKKA